MTGVVPVSLSLMTDDDVFCTSDAGDTRRWRTADRVLRRLVESGGVARAGEMDAPALLRDVAYLEVDTPRLLVPLGEWAVESTEVRDVPIELDENEEDYWGDWLGVEFQLEAILQTCRSQSAELVLTCEPPDGFAAKCQVGPTRNGVEAIFVMQNEEMPDGPWAAANRFGDFWILQSPITSEAIGAAARLLMMALRAQGAGPTDVYPSYVLREFMGEL